MAARSRDSDVAALARLLSSIGEVNVSGVSRAHVRWGPDLRPNFWSTDATVVYTAARDASMATDCSIEGTAPYIADVEALKTERSLLLRLPRELRDQVSYVRRLLFLRFP